MAAIKNLKQAACRIREAVRLREPIIVYGDADLDGVASVIIVEEAIRNLGGKAAAHYFPNREIEGYGITQTGLEALKGFAPALLVVVDMGIGNFHEVKLAREKGFSTVVIDHHEILDGVPQADIIVDPKQPGDDYPFKLFSAAGLCFRLAQDLLGEALTPPVRRDFVELAALATLADMMPRAGENQLIIDEGMTSIARSFRPGVRAFFETDVFFNFEDDNFGKRINRIISVLNVRDLRGGIPAAYNLLTAKTVKESKKLIEEFMRINEIRRSRVAAVQQEIEARIAGKNDPIIFEGSGGWENNLLGTIASIFSSQYAKPVFIYRKLAHESVGTVRSIEEVDSVALMKKCKDLLITFGGHPKASGFRVKNENLTALKTCLTNSLPRKPLAKD